jgi:hypothetical protein
MERPVEVEDDFNRLGGGSDPDEAEVKEASCFPCHQKQTESTIHK